VEIVIDPGSPVPPYEQLRAAVAGQVASGQLSAGARLPTVRRLATELGLAVNTVAKAYRELETDGVVRTEGRRGTFVSSTTEPGSAVEAVAADFVAAARRAGLTRAEATRLVERSWS
jgi:DNA-binding transcriptional regulator YhcF (GntR family)